MLSRRDLVGKLAASAAAVWAVGAARKSFALSRGEAPVGAGQAPLAPAQEMPAAGQPIANREVDVVDSGTPSTSSAPAPWELVHPLALGSVVAHGWQVAGLTGVVDGSCVLTLQNQRGRAQRVHLCRNDGVPQGLVYTKQLDLVVMNGGQGDLPTEEGFAQAVAQVAHVLAANERQHQPVLTALLPQAERARTFSDRRLR
jgi:hypothetical protein